jgi:hypothetical protein
VVLWGRSKGRSQESLHGVRNALLFSDVHLGWSICSRHHARWLARLPEAAGDADLIVLNGDVIDGHRRVQRAAERDLVSQLAELVTGWRRGASRRLSRRPSRTGTTISRSARTAGCSTSRPRAGNAFACCTATASRLPS